MLCSLTKSGQFFLNVQIGLNCAAAGQTGYVLSADFAKSRNIHIPIKMCCFSLGWVCTYNHGNGRDHEPGSQPVDVGFVSNHHLNVRAEVFVSCNHQRKSSLPVPSPSPQSCESIIRLKYILSWLTLPTRRHTQITKQEQQKFTFSVTRTENGPTSPKLGCTCDAHRTRMQCLKYLTWTACNTKKHYGCFQRQKIHQWSPLSLYVQVT